MRSLYRLSYGSGVMNQYMLLLVFHVLYLICGIIFLTNTAVIIWKEKSPNHRYQGTALFLLGQLTSKLATNTKTMIFICTTLALAVFLFIAAPVLSEWSLGYLDNRSMYDVQIFSRYNNVYEKKYLPADNYENQQCTDKQLCTESLHDLRRCCSDGHLSDSSFTSAAAGCSKIQVSLFCTAQPGCRGKGHQPSGFQTVGGMVWLSYYPRSPDFMHCNILFSADCFCADFRLYRHCCFSYTDCSNGKHLSPFACLLFYQHMDTFQTFGQGIAVFLPLLREKDAAPTHCFPIFHKTSKEPSPDSPHPYSPLSPQQNAWQTGQGRYPPPEWTPGRLKYCQG